MTEAGYQVDTAELRSAADGFQTCANHLSATRATIEGTNVPVAAFGPTGPATALAADVESAVAATLSQLGQLTGGINELADNLARAADDYDQTEADNRHGLLAAERGRA